MAPVLTTSNFQRAALKICFVEQTNARVKRTVMGRRGAFHHALFWKKLNDRAYGILKKKTKMSKKRKPTFRKCVISSCDTTSFDYDGARLIKFPCYGTDRFYNWLTITKVQLLEGDHYICSRHFLDRYLGSNGNHLCRNAVPTENLDYVKDPRQ